MNKQLGCDEPELESFRFSQPNCFRNKVNVKETGGLKAPSKCERMIPDPYRQPVSG